MANPYLLLLFGLALTWGGAELLVRGSSRLALALGVRPIVVGLTVVALGTSSPEAVVSFLAATRGEGSIALGNVLGSNVANIGLILGTLALLHPLPIHWKSIRRDVFLMLAATGLMVLLAWLGGGKLSKLDGFLLLLFFASYIGYYIKTGQEPGAVEREFERQPGHRRGIALQMLITAGGLVLLLYGAKKFLEAAIQIAEANQIPDAVVGATILAVGTSLPELAASAVAVVRRHYDLAIGNILGSNVLNLAFVLGGVSAINGVQHDPIQIQAEGGARLLWLMLAFTGVLVLLLRIGTKLTRLEGAILLIAYVGFALLFYLG